LDPKYNLYSQSTCEGHRLPRFRAGDTEPFEATTLLFSSVSADEETMDLLSLPPPSKVPNHSSADDNDGGNDVDSDDATMSTAMAAAAGTGEEIGTDLAAMAGRADGWWHEQEESDDGDVVLALEQLLAGEVGAGGPDCFPGWSFDCLFEQRAPVAPIACDPWQLLLQPPLPLPACG
jgi:hypothetical protein